MAARVDVVVTRVVFVVARAVVLVVLEINFKTSVQMNELLSNLAVAGTFFFTLLIVEFDLWSQNFDY